MTIAASHDGSTTASASPNAPLPLTVAHGDGIGPEIMAATLRVLQAAGADLAIETIEVGAKLYSAGYESGIAPDAWDSIARTRLFLKAPITTPQGSGVKSLNVTFRKTLGLYANVRPCRVHPGVAAQAPAATDLVIVRENEEDTYGGIEHRHTTDVVQCLKLITRPGCERIARYAFAYARAHGRRKITCITKDNIMKMTDGLFRRVFEEVGQDYPDIETDHRIVDIAAARLATRPTDYDVVLAPNLYGDILSDIAAEVTGSVGLAPSANIGAGVAMFEAVHGSAPDIAGRGIANPSALLLAAVMMLEHVGRQGVARRVRAAWGQTLREGIHTGDIKGATTTRLVGTEAFADAVIERLAGAAEAPVALDPVIEVASGPSKPAAKPVKALVGVDLFFDWSSGTPDQLAAAVNAANDGGLALRLISSRGMKVWPEGHAGTMTVDHWRCRFRAGNGAAVTLPQITGLMDRLFATGLEVIKVENLYTYDGVQGFSALQGE